MHNDSLEGKDQVHTIEIQNQPQLNPSVATKFKPNLGCDTNAVPACYSTIGLFLLENLEKILMTYFKKSLKTQSKKGGKSYYVYEKVM